MIQAGKINLILKLHHCIIDSKALRLHANLQTRFEGQYIISKPVRKPPYGHIPIDYLEECVLLKDLSYHSQSKATIEKKNGQHKNGKIQK